MPSIWPARLLGNLGNFRPQSLVGCPHCLTGGFWGIPIHLRILIRHEVWEFIILTSLLFLELGLEFLRHEVYQLTCVAVLALARANQAFSKQRAKPFLSITSSESVPFELGTGNAEAEQGSHRSAHASAPETSPNNFQLSLARGSSPPGESRKRWKRAML